MGVRMQPTSRRVRLNRVMGEQSGEFDEARAETVRYHEELYDSSALGEAGTWLARPDPLLFDALELLPLDRPLVAYDLGAGIGRHTLPLLRRLPSGSEVYAVDLLPSALEHLEAATPTEISTVLHTVRTDLNDFDFPRPADLVLAFSAVEHLPDPASVRALLERISAATRPGGVVALGIVADRFEITADGTRRPALVESHLSVTAAGGLLAAVFAGFEVIYRRLRPAEIGEERDGEHYTLSSTLVTWLGVRPADA